MAELILNDNCLLVTCLYIGTIFAIFSLSGNVPVDNNMLKTIDNRLTIS